MQETVTVACAQVEPVVFDLNATIDRIDQVAAEATGKGAKLVLFPEAYIPAYPSNRWARYLAAGQDATGVYAKLARSSVEIPGPASERLGDPRAGRRLPGRPALGRGGHPDRRARPSAPVRRTPAL